MSTDYKSGQPIRSEADGADEKVIVKIIDGQTGGSNQMTVDSDQNAHVEMHGNQPTTGTDIVLRLSEQGAVNPDGDYDASLNTKPASIGLIVHDRATTPSETDSNFRPTGVAGTVNDQVHAVDVALHDEAGNPYSDVNPMPVSIVDSEGSEINDYFESTAPVAKDGSDEHIFTAAAITKITQIELCSSVRTVFLIEFAPDGSTYTKHWTKINSTSNPNVSLMIKEVIELPIGGKVKITRTNRDNQPATLYSTISGHTVT